MRGGGILKVWGPMPKKEYVKGLEGLIEARGDVFGGCCGFVLVSIDLLAVEI